MKRKLVQTHGMKEKMIHDDPEAKFGIGNLANTVVLLNSLAFMAVVILQEKGIIDVLSTSFLEDGFCVAFKDKSVYVQSHMMCFYGDTAFTIFLYALVQMKKGSVSDEALEPIKKNIFGIFFHGVGHASLALYGEKPKDVTPWEGTESGAEFARAALGLGLFWYAFMRGILGRDFGHLSVVCFTVFYTAVHLFLIVARFGFTYVQTALLVTAAIASMSKDPKSQHYNAIALIINTPIGFVSWIEGIACDSFFKHIGGHLWYDLTIPLSMCAYYWYVSGIEANKHSKVE